MLQTPLKCADDAYRGLIDLIFVKTCPVGRELINIIDRKTNRTITGRWVDTRKVDGVFESSDRDLVGLDDDPLSMIRDHVNGVLLHGGKSARLLAYVVSADGYTTITAIDIDVAGPRHKAGGHVLKTRELGLAAAILVCEAARAMGLVPHIEGTRSGGFRVWIFHHRIKASTARALGALLVARSGLHKKTEVFPKQNVCSSNGTGSGLFAPYYGGADPGCQVFIVPETGELLPFEEFVTAALAGRSDPGMVEAIVAAAVAAGELAAATVKPAPRHPDEGDGFSGDDLLSREDRAPAGWAYMESRCKYIAKLVADAEAGMQLPYDDWLLLLGMCRWFGKWGRKKAHELSAHDDRYNEIETDAKLDSLSGKPFTCEKSGCGHDRCNDCGMPPNKKSPVYFAYRGLLSLPVVNNEEVDVDGSVSGLQVEYNFRAAVPGPPWDVNGTGVWKVVPTKEGENCILILPHGLYIEERVSDLDTGVESVTLVWPRDHRERRRTVEKKVIASSRDIVALANDGILVNSTNSREIVRYLHDIQAEHSQIPVVHSVSTCGWKEIGGQDVFMWGSTPIGSPTAPAPTVKYNADSQETSDLLAATRSAGMLDSWMEIIPLLQGHPIAQFALMASFLPPFLEVLQAAQNPVIEIAGHTSVGKTTLLMVVASVWGYPPQMGGLIRNWNATPVYIERFGSASNGLPIIFDESQNARADQIQLAVYQVANGTGRGRGTKEGSVQKIAKYRSVLFSAGEQRITTSSDFDGSAARVTSFWGSPFGTGQVSLVTRLRDITMNSYGHAGPSVVTAYLQDPEKIGTQMRKLHTEALTRLQGQTQDDVAQRLAGTFALVEAVGHFVKSILKLDCDVRSIVNETFAMATRERTAPRHQRVLEQVISWADSNELAFTCPDPSPSRPTALELAGVIHGNGSISFMPDKLQRILSERKADYASMISHWMDENWLITDTARRQHSVKIGGNKRMCITFSAEAVTLARLNGTADADPEDPKS